MGRVATQAHDPQLAWEKETGQGRRGREERKEITKRRERERERERRERERERDKDRNEIIMRKREKYNEEHQQ